MIVKGAEILCQESVAVPMRVLAEAGLVAVWKIKYRLLPTQRYYQGTLAMQRRPVPRCFERRFAKHLVLVGTDRVLT